MQLSETVEWGLHACLALAMMPEGARIPARALAEYHGIKPGYFSKAMQKLVAAGIIQSVEGRSGGLAMAKRAEDVPLLQIVMALEDHKTFFRCTEIRQKGPCAAAPKHYRAPCNIARVMHKADAEWRRVLATTSLADLRLSAAAEPIPGVNEATQDWLAETGAVRGLETQMQNRSGAHPSGQSVGIVLMVAAMLVIPIVDGLAKYLSDDYSPLFISWARYAASTALILPIAFARNGRRVLPTDGIPLHATRTLCLVGAMTLYFFAISKVSLVIAASAYFVGPLIAVALSVIFLDERLTVAKILGMLVGLIGALIVLQPSGDFDAYALLALGAGCLFAAYLVITRRTSAQSDPIRTLSFQCLVGTLLLTPPAIFVAEIPAFDLVPLFVGLGLFSLLGHFLTIIAFQKAEASTLAPLVYVELIGAAAIGFLIFSDVPRPSTIVGAVLIAAAGLVVSIRPRDHRPR